MNDLIFLKLGGSLLTDKTQTEALRGDVLARLAAEIAAARAAAPGLRLVLGHGSGSFGHVAAARHGTRQGVKNAEQWRGFAAVSDAASRLNRHVVGALLAGGVPAISLQPSASAQVADGRISQLALEPLAAALAAGLVPVVFGDVAFDSVRGGTIISTEEIMDYLAHALQPRWLLLAGETAGVLDQDGQIIPTITRATLPDVLPALGGSRGIDVTGGMIAKVTAMLDLADARPGLAVRIFSGLEPGLLTRLLIDPALPLGTRLA
ncbi:isopentenyl phosphate kinase [Promineifilum sp.]|uniref:isopentenyl phosphate kinase n=1 Tax=Promineifilum sp. TaxID=2664178 RepID=UPI0035B1666A